MNFQATSPTFGKIVRLGRIFVVGSIVCVDAVTGLVSHLQGKDNSTSYTAHLSGVGMGLLVGLVILKNRRVQFWEQWLRVVSCSVAGAFILVMILINLFVPSLFLPVNYSVTECSTTVK